MKGSTSALALAVIAGGCAGSVSHDWRYALRAPEHEDIFAAEGSRDPRRLRPEQRAILLVPEGTRVALSGDDRSSRTAFSGPARVFFVPGLRRFGASTLRRAEGGTAGGSFSFELEMRRGHAYELRVSETDKAVRWEVVDLGAERYERLHSGDRVQPVLPEVAPVARPWLPAGLQPDGSVVVPGDERLGLPPLHFSAALFPCDDDERLGLLASLRSRPVEQAVPLASLLDACPELELEDGARPELGLELLRCAHERFASKGRFPSGSEPARELCSQVLGPGWSIPSLAQLKQLSEQQLRALIRPPPGDALAEPLAPGLVFAVTDEGRLVRASASGALGSAQYPAWVRCVRDATQPEPPVPSVASSCVAR